MSRQRATWRARSRRDRARRRLRDLRGPPRAGCRTSEVQARRTGLGEARPSAVAGFVRSCSGVERRTAAAAFIRERVPVILPRVVAEAVAGDASSVDLAKTRRLLTEYLERRIPLWLVALAANDDQRDEAIARLLRMDDEAGTDVPPVVVLGP